ncbi:MAG: SUMF1/EgtB/PvdO family nonheme iron enzyme [Deltaproteobacteria bacterium]|nr:SUMF1/EgtB/PvdO family nonheme iron enzyme [Deltaproteobacteria bacterium]
MRTTLWLMACLLCAACNSAGDAADAGDPIGQDGSPADSTSGATCDGLPGPPMIHVQAPEGTTYCIDSTEVTQAHYAQFLAAVQATPGTEHPECGLNKDYSPTLWPDSAENEFCKHDMWTPSATPNRPVVCIDWCDAYAYCTWAGKRLCGKVGGGPGPFSPGTVSGPDPNNPAANASLSEWYNACSQGGITPYPYGDTYQPTTCLGWDALDPDAGGKGLGDVGSFAGCHGTAAPYSFIADLSGSVSEFTDESYVSPNDGFKDYVSRGGSYANGHADMSCISASTVGANAPGPATGVRCCKSLL